MRHRQLAVSAAADEYESASFSILAGKDLVDVRVSLTEFVRNGKVPSAAASAELFVVKSWLLPTNDEKWLPISVMYPE